MESQIKAIPQSSVHKITSGQVVVDLQTAVKELVENSLDAGATSIEVRFKDYGLKSIEVVDNGSGIKPADYESIALKHHTSKLSAYTDLASVSSFGFRGEALSSLCALAESMTMTTATEEDAPMGTVLEFDRSGHLTSSASKVARQKGTTVTITNLFASLPVRRAELSRNIKREHSKAVALLTAYAMVPCSKPPGVRFTVSNQPEGGKKSIQIRTDGAPNLKNNIASLWGRKSLDTLVDVHLQLEVQAETAMLKRAGLTSLSTEVRCQGVASLPTFASSRSSPDRQYLFLNSRPCTLPKVQKAIAEVWHSFCVQGHGMWALDLALPTDAYDVNVSPDKRTILLHNEENVISALKAALEELWAPTRSTFAVNGGGSRSNSDQMISAGTDSGDIDEEVDELQDEEDTPVEEASKLTKKFSNTRAGKEPKRIAERASTWPTAPAKKSASRDTGRQANARKIQKLFESSEDEDVDAEIAEPPSSLPVEWERARDPISPKVHSSTAQEPFNDQPVSLPAEYGQAPSSQFNEPKMPSARDLELVDVDDAQSSGPDDLQMAGLEPKIPSSLPSTPVKASGHSERPTAILSTLNASWSRERPSPSNERIAKRRKLSPAPSGVSIGQFQKRLQHFASGVTAITRSTLSDDDDLLSGNEEPSDEEAGDDKHDADMSEPPGVTLEHLTSEAPFSRVRETSPLDVVDLTTEDITMAEDPPIVAEKIAANIGDRPVNGTKSNKAGVSSRTPTVEILRDGESAVRALTVNMDSIRTKWGLKAAHTGSDAHAPASSSKVTLDKAGLKVDSAAQAEATLSRAITKADFDRMEILGQFNLGFVIVRLRKDDGKGGKVYDELFIVDQHAADEKYNFETLQQTTRIQSQTLFKPRPLELTPADELVAIENLNILRENGFEVEEVEVEASEDNTEGERQSRLLLTAQPISKETVFDMKDLEELLHLMQDAPTGQMVRCSKARSMFAMRACRRSVMIGKALTRQQMTTVIRHMGTMDQPWNCPHGRPTMRHLLSMPDLLKRLSKKQEISWHDFKI